jgi:hypothetical protein
LVEHLTGDSGDQIHVAQLVEHMNGDSR